MERSKRRRLPDIAAVAICAVLCGADSWVYVEMSGRGREDWFRTFPDLLHGIFSYGTPGDVFSLLDPGQFRECLRECLIDWTRAVAALMPGEVAASTAGLS